MERDELIQRSELIFEGLVAQKNSRWNDRGNLIVTDYVFDVSRVIFGENRDQVTLTFAGGTVGEETHSLSSVPEFEVREHVILMVSDMTAPALSPISGGVQGKFVASDDGLVLDGHGNLVKVDGRAVTFRDFNVMLRNEVPNAREKTLPNRNVKPENLVHVLQDLPALRYEPSEARNRQDNDLFEKEVGVANQDGVSKHNGVSVENQTSPPQEEPIETGQPDTPAERIFSDRGGVDTFFSGQLSRYAYDNKWASTPIVFNPLVTTISWDQHNMSRWNRYGNTFTVLTSPTGTWAWTNDRNDVAGFVDSQTMVAQFGQGWGAGTLAVCWTRSVNNTIIETDIAFNSAISWSLNEFATFDDPNLFALETVCAHELGHALGLNHQFEFMSVMNYPPKKYDAYNKLYTDDTEAIRALYPSNAVSQSDVGISMYYHNGGGQHNNYSDADLNKTSVEAGSTIRVSNFTLCNTGTTSMAPEIDWYLVPQINSWSGNRYIGSTTHVSLNSFAFNQSTRTLSIPSSTPRGTYYLAARVSNSNDAQNQNNSSWLDREIAVTIPPANDDLVDAFELNSLEADTGSNVDATTETNEPDIAEFNALRSVWWKGTATVTGFLNVDTFGSNFDTVLHVYRSPSGSMEDLVLLDRDDDSGGTAQSFVRVPVVAGDEIAIRVAGFGGATGNIEVHACGIGPKIIVSGGDLIVRGGNDDNDIFVVETADTTFVEIDGKLQTYPGIYDVTVLGFDGNDTITSSIPGIIVNGMNGNDIITFTGTGVSELIGGNGDDTIRGGSGPDVIFGGAGNDLIIGRAGNDTMYGGTGDDEMRGISGRNLISGGSGNNELYGGTGPDEIVGGIGDDVIFGGNGADDIRGGGGLNVIDGGLASDNIIGGSGRDEIRGGPGNDTIYGLAGNDELLGDAGSDEIIGGPGNDLILGGPGLDRLFGQAGDDILRGEASADSLVGGGGNDQLNGGSGPDELFGGGGSDVLTGGDGFDALHGGQGNDTATDEGEAAETSIEN